ncbi:hypothetical protein RCL1_005337 [Eukaryota sp. TZLM3-RCL]
MSQLSVIEKLLNTLTVSSELNKTSVFVTDLLKDPLTEQHKHCVRYINQVFRHAELDSSQRGNLVNPQTFISALVELTIASYGLSPKDAFAVEHAIEEFLFPQIYSKLMLFCQSDTDIPMNKQYDLFSSVSQEQLKVSSSMLDESLSPWSHAIAKISSLPLSPTPTRKLQVVLSAARSVYCNPNICADTSIGADVFVPIFIYVLLKARVPTIWSEIQFIHEYASERHVHGELGYYFVTLEFASKYILELTKDKLETDSNDLFSDTTTILVPEKSRFIDWSRKFNFVDYDSETVSLNGYKAVVLIPWILDSLRPYSVVLEATNRQNDVVNLLVLRPNFTKLTISQRGVLKSLFLSPETIHPSLSSVSTHYGNVVVVNETGIDVEKVYCDEEETVDECVEREKMTISMILMGAKNTCPDRNFQSLESNFRSIFHIPSHLTLIDSLGGLVVEFQLFLHLFDCLPLIAPLNGTLDTPTCHGIIRLISLYNGNNSEQGFAKMFNVSPSFLKIKTENLKYSGFMYNMLPENSNFVDNINGVAPFSPNILYCLRQLLTNIRTELAGLQFPTPNPLLNFSEFSAKVSEFQSKYGPGKIPVRNGVLNIPTLKTLSALFSETKISFDSQISTEISISERRKFSLHRVRSMDPSVVIGRLSNDFVSDKFIPLELYPTPPKSRSGSAEIP